MFHVFKPDRNYLIDSSLNVKYKNEIISTKLIELRLGGVAKKVSREWMLSVAYMGLEMSKGYESHMFDLYFKDYNLMSHGIFIKTIPVFKTPITVLDKYRIIPVFPRYAISRDGEVYSMRTSKIVRPRMRNGYMIIHLGLNSYRVSRLVALAWVENSDFISKPIVNHIDGNKLNNNYKNLEWCSFTENNNHLISAGLSSQALGLRIYDLVTHEEEIYMSIRSFCKTKNIPMLSKLAENINKYCQYRVNKRYLIKLIDNEDAWVMPSEKYIHRPSVLLECMNLETRQVYKGSVSELSKKVNVSETEILSRIRMIKQKPINGYLFRDPKYMSWNTMLSNYRKTVLRVLAIKNGDSRIFTSIREAARWFGCDKKTISSRLNSDITYKEYIFKQI